MHQCSTEVFVQNIKSIKNKQIQLDSTNITFNKFIHQSNHQNKLKNILQSTDPFTNPLQLQNFQLIDQNKLKIKTSKKWHIVFDNYKYARSRNFNHINTDIVLWISLQLQNSRFLFYILERKK